MRCPYCNGRKEIINAAMIYTSCPACHGTGEYIVTNKQFIQNGGATEIAECFFNFLMTISTPTEKLRLYNKKEKLKEKLSKWLGEEHK